MGLSISPLRKIEKLLHFFAGFAPATAAAEAESWANGSSIKMKTAHLRCCLDKSQATVLANSPAIACLHRQAREIQSKGPTALLQRKTGKPASHPNVRRRADAGVEFETNRNLLSPSPGGS